MAIHSTAVVDRRAEIGDCEIGPYAVIGAGVRLCDGVVVGAHAVIDGPTVIGARTRVGPHAVLGGAPQSLRHDGSETRLEIGEDNVFREFASAHRGSSVGTGVTRIGDRNWFMCNAHVAHDCVVGSGCIFANSAAIGGHVEVGDGANLGGLVGVHQNVRVGRLAMVGAGAICAQDVPPFSLAQGDRAVLFGLNVVGLRRAGFTPDRLSAVKAAWRVLFADGLALRNAIGRVREAGVPSVEVEELLSFCEGAHRGVCRASMARGQST